MPVYPGAPRGVGESHCYGSGRVRDVRRACERNRVRRRSEHAGQESAFGMGRAKTGVEPEDRIELVQQLLTERKKLFIGGQQHRGSPFRNSP